MNTDNTSIYNLPCGVPDTWEGFLDLAARHKHIQVAPISCSAIEDLAQCPCYERLNGDMSAAHRGTAMHMLMSIPEENWPLDLPLQEMADLREARRIERAYIAQVISRESQQGGGFFDFGGTVDLIGYDHNKVLMIADYKFGGQPKRSDSLQLIAYAKLMHASKTMVIQPGQEPYLHSVTGEDLTRLGEALNAARGDKPTPCELCRKCINQDVCPAIMENMQAIQKIQEPAQIALPTDPVELGKLMDRIDVAEGVCETIRERIKKMLVDGQEVSGWKLSSSKRQQTAWKKLAEAKCSAEEIARETSVQESISMRRSKR